MAHFQRLTSPFLFFHNEQWIGDFHKGISILKINWFLYLYKRVSFGLFKLKCKNGTCLRGFLTDILFFYGYLTKTSWWFNRRQEDGLGVPVSATLIVVFATGSFSWESKPSVEMAMLVSCKTWAGNVRAPGSGSMTAVPRSLSVEYRLKTPGRDWVEPHEDAFRGDAAMLRLSVFSLTGLQNWVSTHWKWLHCSRADSP